MTLPVKEYYHNHTTGQVTIEYSDDSTKSFNMNDVVTSQIDPVNGGIGIIGPAGKQIAGNAAPYAFTSRALADTDNGMTRVCASAQAATVNAGLPAGFGCAFKGAISFVAGSGVTITDVRTTGAANPWCALVQTAADTYDVVGTKA